MTSFLAELTALRANLCAAYDAADRWLEEATKDPRSKADQLQIRHVRKMAQAYSAFRAALAQLEARP